MHSNFLFLNFVCAVYILSKRSSLDKSVYIGQVQEQVVDYVYIQFQWLWRVSVCINCRHRESINE